MSANCTVIRFLQGACSALLVATLAPVSAAPIMVNFNAVLSGLSLSGTGSVPLARDPAAPGCLTPAPGTCAADGYAFVGVAATVTQTAGMPSTLSSTLTIDDTSFATSISSSFTYYLDISLTDTDAGSDFFGETDGATLMFSAVLTGTASGAVSFDLGPPPGVDLSGVTVTAPKFKHSLGVDVNGNGLLDELVLTASDFDLDFESLLLDDIDLDLVTIIGLGTPVVDIIPPPLSISAGTLTLSGLVRDEALDPPFSLTLDIDSPLTIGFVGPTAVAEPPLLALLGAGGVLLLLTGRRARQA